MRNERRQTRGPAVLLAVLLGLGVTACDNAPPEKLVDPLSEAWCDWAMGCCDTDELANDAFGIFGALNAGAPASGVEADNYILDAQLDRDRCLELAKAGLRRFYDAPLAHAQGGLMSLSDSRLDSCTSYFSGAAGSCGIGAGLPPGDARHPCAVVNLFEGAVAAGGKCTMHADCADGLHCEREGAHGACAARKGLDQPCESDAGCEDEFVCVGFGFGVCAQREKAQAGEFCDRQHAECADGLYCSQETHRCKEQQKAGELCTEDANCAAGYCDLGTFTCAAAQTPGQACRGTGECDTASWCKPGAVASVCVSEKRVGEGELCAGNEVVCNDGLVCEASFCVRRSELGGWCDDSSGINYCPDQARCRHNVCVELGSFGAACQNHGDCKAEFHCDGGSGTCAWRAAQGEPCDVAPCRAELWCDPGMARPTCVGRSGMGMACDTDPTRCAKGLWCDTNATPTAVCVPLAAAGEACDQRACGDDLVCRNNAGTCQARLGQDINCTVTESCQTELYCAALDNPEQTCEALQVVGQGQPCGGRDVACQAGLYCDGARCLAAGGAAAACNDDIHCQAWLYCEAGACTARKAQGQPCGRDRECQDGTLYCAGGACTPRVGMGAPCATHAGCGAGTWCDGNSGTCQAVVPVKSACTTDAQCATGLYCAAIGARCAPRHDLGVSCQQGARPCKDGLRCANFGVCRQVRHLGETCDPAADRCDDDTFCANGTRTCEALIRNLPGGAMCAFGPECVSGVCANGVCIEVCEGKR